MIVKSFTSCLFGQKGGANIVAEIAPLNAYTPKQLPIMLKDFESQASNEAYAEFVEEKRE